MLDSTRWKRYVPRRDDIIITTSYRSGTTWMQMIMKHLVIPDGSWETFNGFSRWLESRVRSLDDVIAHFESQTHRRCIKSHLALDGLPYYPQVKYLVVARDPRDVFMSFWNQYSNFSDEWLDNLDAIPDRVGERLPRCHGDIHRAWHDWITRGWFDWESEGYPYWGNMHHTQTYWAYRDLPNVLLVHYNNLLERGHAELRRITEFLEMDVTDERIQQVVELTMFQNVRKQSEVILGEMPILKGGSKTFIHKGTNGRWRDVLSDDELQLYDAAKKRVLEPDCAHWLETGILR